MKFRQSFVVAVSFFLSIGVVVPAYATPIPAEPTQAERDIARAYVKEGRDLMNVQQYERAAELFKKAHDIMHAPTTALELMNAYAYLGKDVEAWELGEEIQRQVAPPGESEAYKEARIQIDDAMEGLATRVSTLVLRFKGERPRGVVVTIDDKPVSNEQLDKPFRVNRGEHVVTCTAPDFAAKRISQWVRAKTSEEFVISIDMERLAPPPRSDLTDERRHLPGQRTNASMPLWIPWTGFGVTAGAAIILGSAAGSTYSTMSEAWNNPAFSASREKQYQENKPILQRLSISSLAVGAVSLGAFGFALYQTLHVQKASPRAQIVLTSNGVSVVGVW